MASKPSYPLSNKLVERVLAEAKDYLYLDNENTLYTVLPGRKKIGCDLYTFYQILGRHKDIFKVSHTIEPEIPQGDWMRAILVCNEYNMTSVYGTAYLQVKEGHNTAKLYFVTKIQLKEGATEEFIDDFLKCVFGDAIDFFELAHSKKGLY
jgi:hypothetical protein